MPYTKQQQSEIDNAIDLLKSYGYYVNNLWHIDDVKYKFKCSDEDAYEILENAMENDATYEQIWLSIDSSISIHSSK